MHGLSTYLRRHHIGLLALFIALGGTSYAAVSLSANSVGARELKNQAVGASEIKDGSIMKRDLRERLYESLRGGGSGDRRHRPGRTAGTARPRGPGGGSRRRRAHRAATRTRALPTAWSGPPSWRSCRPRACARPATRRSVPGDGSTATVSFTDPSSEQYDIGEHVRPGGRRDRPDDPGDGHLRGHRRRALAGERRPASATSTSTARSPAA